LSSASYEACTGSENGLILMHVQVTVSSIPNQDYFLVNTFKFNPFHLCPQKFM